MGKLIYEDLARQKGYGSDFIKEVRNISSALKIDPNWLMAIFRSESGMSHSIMNAMGCVGFIQFCPGGGLAAVNKTAQELASMSGKDQLYYVYKQFEPVKGKINSAEELYLYNFYPYAFYKGKINDPNWIFGSEQSMSYARSVKSWNPGFDVDKDGYVSMKDFLSYIRSHSFKDLPKQQKNISSYLDDDSFIVPLWLLLVAIILVYIFRKEIKSFYLNTYKNVVRKPLENFSKK